MRRGRNNLKNAVIQKIRAEGLEPLVVVVEGNLAASEAFALERKLILRYGRRDLRNGILTNLTDGGDGPLNISPETREKMRQRMTGAGSPTFGVGHTPEAREKMSKAQRERVEKGLVTRHSEEWKQHLRENNAGGKATSKRVLKFTLKGELVEVFQSMSAAAKSVGMTKNNFSYSVVRDGSIPRDGYFYRYEESEDITPSGIRDAERLIARRDQHERGALSGKRVKKLMGENEIVYESIKEASRHHPEIKYATLWASLKYGRNCAGARWVYC